MNMRNPRWLAAVWLAMCAISVGAATAHAADSARLLTYDAPSGEQYFALSVQPEIPVRLAPTDVVVLFDTSASQAGSVRDDSLAALRSMLGTLNNQTRVRLVAVDLNAVPLTDGFVAPGSDAMREALAKLERRVPLGSTDMGAALAAAANSFSPAADVRRAAVYIGDGVTGANFLQGPEFARLISQLVEKEVAMSSFAIGPQIDAHLLAAVANQTGGRLILESHQLSPVQTGEFLAAAAEAPVVWTSGAELPAELEAVYPQTIPPLRADRETVIIGKSKLAGPIALQINGSSMARRWNTRLKRCREYRTTTTRS